MDDLIAELRAVVEAQSLPPILTRRQVADVLDCTENHLIDLRRARKGPPFLRLSHKMVRYDREDVLAWARSHRVETRSGGAA